MAGKKGWRGIGERKLSAPQVLPQSSCPGPRGPASRVLVGGLFRKLLGTGYNRRSPFLFFLSVPLAPFSVQ